MPVGGSAAQPGGTMSASVRLGALMSPFFLVVSFVPFANFVVSQEEPGSPRARE
jgi:hypothetical protein